MAAFWAAFYRILKVWKKFLNGKGIRYMEQKNKAVKTSEKKEFSLKGTLFSVMFIGGFIINSWCGVDALFLSRKLIMKELTSDSLAQVANHMRNYRNPGRYTSAG